MSKRSVNYSPRSRKLKVPFLSKMLHGKRVLQSCMAFFQRLYKEFYLHHVVIGRYSTYVTDQEISSLFAGVVTLGLLKQQIQREDSEGRKQGWIEQGEWVLGRMEAAGLEAKLIQAVADQTGIWPSE